MQRILHASLAGILCGNSWAGKHRQQQGMALAAQGGAPTARKYCWSRSCLATSLADWPDTSIQVMEKTAQTAGTQAE